MTRTVVVGGGIAGLAAAWFLTDAGLEVTVLEAGAQVGGKLRVEEVAGVAIDVGAESVLARRPEAVDLARAVGRGDDLIVPTASGAGIRAGGIIHPLPAKTLMGIPTDLDAARASGALSEAALAAVAGEPEQPPLPPLHEDVGVGRLVRSRLGDEVVDRLVEPLLGGVYAGRAEELSLQATVPALAARLALGGSLVAAARALAGPGTQTASDGPVFASLRGGLGSLPRSLARSGRFTVRTGVTARDVRRSAAGFVVECGPVPAPEQVPADRVVVAVPPVKAARLLRTLVPAAAAELAGIEQASVAIITLAYRDVALPAGSGLLVGATERLAVKGVTLSSQKWPLPAGRLVLLRASVGRAGEARDLQRDDDELVRLVRRELRELIGVTAEPVDALVTRWGGGLPQYAVGHLQRVARIRSAVATVPGLAVCGAAYDGVGVPACIASARRAVAEITGTAR